MLVVYLYNMQHTQKEKRNLNACVIGVVGLNNAEHTEWFA